MKTTEVVFGGTKLKGIPVLILNILLLIGICVLFGWCVSTYEEQAGCLVDCGYHSFTAQFTHLGRLHANRAQ
ncbi:MAG: hypothetical protein NTY32_05845 [Bacteroidia bacterium]|nr:hypothetical protein [Bacteroidia bacterium]